MHQEDILFNELAGVNGRLGVITLNRPKALNALNYHMIKLLTSQLKQWAQDAEIKAVIIMPVTGSRAFCAGGDLRATYEHWHDGSLAHFFYTEYQLNRLIFHYPKPYIAFLDGITMGGGVGISIHGSHRVATENLLFAMPETSIGFYPDVGGSYFLPRLTGEIGTYLGLTGVRIGASECITLGIATQCVPAKSLSLILQTLTQTDLAPAPAERVSAVLNQYHVTPAPSSFFAQQEKIKHCFSASSIENIITRLQADALPFSQDTLNVLAKKSPTSLKVSLEVLRQGKHLDFDACMRNEYRLTHQFLKNPDFLEGIRALIIDKDQAPRWQPATLADVTPPLVKSYFQPLKEELC